MSQPVERRQRVEQQINNLLLNLDHSAPSITKYRPLEELFSQLLSLRPPDIYVAYMSKAGNVSVRFNQSDRARNAKFLVALAEPPPTEPLSRTVEALRRYCQEKRPGMEALIISRRDGRWAPDTLIAPSNFDSEASSSASQRLITEWYDLRVLTYVLESQLRLSEESRLKFVVSTENLNVLPPYPYVLLSPDGWNDYGFITSFGMKLLSSADQVTDLEFVKILRRDQEKTATQLPSQPFANLGPSYCSLGQSYSYYEAIRQLPEQLSKAILRGLRDVVYDQRILTAFEHEPGFEKSLLRNGSAARALRDAPSLFDWRAESTKGAGMRFKFTTHVGGSPFTISFAFGESSKLPDRICAIIGYNGTGKTQLLANMALVATGDMTRRQQLVESAGAFDQASDVRFGAVVAISYSAFDTFAMPNSLWGMDELLANKRLEERGEVNGYTYCGLRRGHEGQPHDTHSPRGLKTIDEVAYEFSAALSLAQANDKRSLLLQVLSILGSEPSFGRVGVDPFREREVNDWRPYFESLSTGHKIVLNIVVQLVAHCEPGSLFLIDEPETHLQTGGGRRFRAAVGRGAAFDRGDMADVGSVEPAEVNESQLSSTVDLGYEFCVLYSGRQ